MAKKYQARYKLPSSGKNSGHPSYWLLVLGLGAFLGWLWWQSARSPKQKQAANHTKTAANIVATNVPLVPRTNIVISRHSVSPLPVTNAPSLQHSNTPVIQSSNSAPSFPRPVQNPFEAQIALIGQGISPGSIDGAVGSQTRAAITAFQWQQGENATGQLDTATKNQLALENPPYTTYTVTSGDLARLQPVAATWLGKSQQSALDYETILELVAEKTFAHPNLIRRLNPNVDWTNIVAGTTLQVPNAVYPENPGKAAWLTIHLSAKTLEAFDSDTNLIAHFPCSIAKRVEKRPVGLLRVVVVAPNPNYTFDPDVFPESAEARQIGHKLVLPPGPNNPVGVAWIGLDRPGYGIHGTPRPEDVGRTESHGCFRLANWNAEFLLKLITVGTPVYVVE